MSDVSARARGLVCPPFDILNQKAAALRQAGHRVISLGQAVPGFPPPDAPGQPEGGAVAYRTSIVIRPMPAFSACAKPFAIAFANTFTSGWHPTK